MPLKLSGEKLLKYRISTKCIRVLFSLNFRTMNVRNNKATIVLFEIQVNMRNTCRYTSKLPWVLVTQHNARFGSRTLKW